jgi:uncharacterized membrane protein
MSRPGEQAATVLAECRAQRARALRWTVLYGVLAAALVCAVTVAVASGRGHAALFYLILVLLLVNLVRLGQCLMALAKIRRAERIIYAARLAEEAPDQRPTSM